MSRVFKQAALKKLMGNPSAQFDGLMKRPARRRTKGMNKIETAFSRVLECAQAEGKIRCWHFESVRLTIAPNTTYTPDFIAVLPNGHWQVFEIKGFLEDDASIKFKAATERFPEISFQMLRREKKTGEWITVFNMPSLLNPGTPKEITKSAPIPKT